MFMRVTMFNELMGMIMLMGVGVVCVAVQFEVDVHFFDLAREII